ncbi:MAG: hypothetical protein U0790_12105 [Isosphaeraceae bacterium]
MGKTRYVSCADGAEKVTDYSTHLDSVVSGANLQLDLQYFHEARASIHNLEVHGQGIVSGLEVEAAPDCLTVQPGVGIDRLGRTIALREPLSIVKGTDRWPSDSKQPQMLGLVAREKPHGADNEKQAPFGYLYIEMSLEFLPGEVPSDGATHVLILAELAWGQDGQPTIVRGNATPPSRTLAGASLGEIRLRRSNYKTGRVSEELAATIKPRVDGQGISIDADLWINGQEQSLTTQLGALGQAIQRSLPVAGGTITGDLRIDQDLSIKGVSLLSTLNTLSGEINRRLPLAGGTITGDLGIDQDLTIKGVSLLSTLNTLSGEINGRLPLAGGTMTGALHMADASVAQSSSIRFNKQVELGNDYSWMGVLKGHDGTRGRRDILHIGGVYGGKIRDDGTEDTTQARRGVWIAGNDIYLGFWPQPQDDSRVNLAGTLAFLKPGVQLTESMPEAQFMVQDYPLLGYSDGDNNHTYKRQQIPPWHDDFKKWLKNKGIYSFNDDDNWEPELNNYKQFPYMLIGGYSDDSKRTRVIVRAHEIYLGYMDGQECVKNSVCVSGGLIANWKNFRIDHPLNPAQDFLIHGCLEGPEVGVYYRGESCLVDGRARVELPAYFEALTRKEGRTVQLTPLADDDQPISMLAASRVSEGAFTVRMVNRENPSQRFYWEVKAVRADVPPLETELPKSRFNPDRRRD